MQILIDADACPVKDETYKVAARYACWSSSSATAPFAGRAIR
jgi:uncharacterized protein YaiI (UPF0178 family)